MFTSVSVARAQVSDDGKEAVINVSENWSDINFDGDVYILDGVTLNVSGNVTITGNIYVFGTLSNTGFLKVEGTLNCLNYSSSGFSFSAGNYTNGRLISTGRLKINVLNVKDDYLNIDIPVIHTHQWNEGKTIKESTCTQEGEKEYTCETCGAKKTEKISAIGHKWNTNYTIDQKATCEHQGTKSIHCVNCNEIKEESTIIIPAYNHSKTEIRNAKKATYTSDGYTGDTYCKLCGKKLRSGKKIKKLVAKIPQKVTISKLAAGKKKIKVTYKKAKDATKYQIQYSLNKNMKSAKVKTTKNLTYTVSNLKAKKVYYVRVKAINIQGKSGSWSQIKQVKTK